MHPEMLLNSAIDIRKEAGGGFFEPVLSIALFFAARKMKMQIFGSQVWISYLTFSLCMLSVILSFSRTLEVALILISLSVFGWINFQSRIKVMIVVAVVAAIFGLGMSLPPAHENTAHPGVIDKMLNSFQEMKIKEYRGWAEISKNWRGFESARALVTYSSGSLPEYFVGQGLGSLVDLGFYVPLGDKIRFIPTLHNGYMYLLVKTGIIGLFLYFFLLYRVAQTGTILDRSEHMDLKYCGRLIVGIALAFASSTQVVTGMFNKSATLSMSLLLGALLAYTAADRYKQFEVQAK